MSKVWRRSDVINHLMVLLCAVSICLFLIIFPSYSNSQISSPFFKEEPKDFTPLSVPLYVGKYEYGNISILAAKNPKESLALLSPALEAIKDKIPEKQISILKQQVNKQGYLRLRDASKAGIEASFDQNLLAIVINIPAENKRTRSISARSTFDTSNKEIVPTSDVSAFVNIRGSQDYLHSGLQTQERGRQDFRMSMDGAINIRDWVLEGESDFLEDSSSRLWQRGDVRLVHDWPHSMNRLGAGDLSYPISGFQSFQSMLGLSLARNFDLQPYRVSEPTGQTTFFLKTPSRVEIFVNNRKVRTLQLEPGPYDISDFPVVNGTNDVELVITDATGRVERKRYPIISDDTLLAEGIHEFSYNIGLPSTTQNREKRYNDSLLSGSFFHRYGLTKKLTLGGGVQGNTDQQMLGMDISLGTELGILRGDIAGSDIDGLKKGWAARTQYQLINPDSLFGLDLERNRIFTLRAEYKGRRFGALGQTAPNNKFSYTLNARYSQKLTDSVNMGIGSQYRIGRDNQDDSWNHGLSFDKILSNNVRIGLNVEYRDEDNLGAFFSISWTPNDSRNSVNSSYDSFSDTARTDWNYTNHTKSEDISASAGVTRVEERYRATGQLTYLDDRGDVTVRHDIATSFDNDNTDSLKSTESRTQLRFATALAYAGNRFAVSRPITNSFAMICPHKAFEDFTIGVNPQGTLENKNLYEAKIDEFGPAVLTELNPYLYRTAKVDGRNLPAGYSIKKDAFTLFPSYKSGTFIEVGTDANTLVDGALKFKNGDPVSLQAGVVRLIDDNAEPSEVTFFTNRIGRFRIDELKPGNYQVILYKYPDNPLQFTIEKGSAGYVKIGELIVNNK